MKKPKIEDSLQREDYECKHFMNPETCISCKNEDGLDGTLCRNGRPINECNCC